MIITVCGKAGSGKSTIAKELAKRLKLKHYSSGDFMRQMAKEKGLKLGELSKIAEKDKGKIDKEIDARQKKLGKTKKNFVIDGRLSAFFIPKADFKIFLHCDDDVRAKRILGDNRGKENVKSLNAVKLKVKHRESSEKKRYKKYYKFDCYDAKNYDILIDTSKLTGREVANKLIKVIKKT